MATIHKNARLFHLCNSIRERRKKEQKRIDRRKKQQLTVVPPTPLVHYQTPYTQTKHQALDEVLKEIKNSIKRGVHIDTQIFSSLLETCFQLDTVNHGIQIHHLIPADVLRKSVSLSSKLLRLYASCGHIDNAHQLFEEMPKSNTSAFLGILLYLGMLNWVDMKMQRLFIFRRRKKMSNLINSPFLGC
ncbi:hypothetical protein MKX01_008168 [Papaver californicum]|nr:hypothetical protein MKX01_008168 [Papaver californicum]